MQFSENSRVWVYQSDKELSNAQVIDLQIALDNFTTGWTAHNNRLKAKGEVRYNRFIILVVDESQAGATGCSIDKSVHFMKQVEQHFGINLFDRFNLAYRDGEKILSVPRNTFEELVTNKTITAETTVFNNMVQTLSELQTKWEVAFKDSWHVRLFGNCLNQD
jgi:hypothetical protein